MLSTKLFRILNDPGVADVIKRDLEDKIETYDEARNKFVSAKNKDRKQFYRKILGEQEKVLNTIIDQIFGSIPRIPFDRPISEELDEDDGRPAFVDGEEGKYDEMTTRRRDFDPDEYFGKEERYAEELRRIAKKRPIRRTQKEQIEYFKTKEGLEDFASKRASEDVELELIDIDISELEINARRNFQDNSQKLKKAIDDLRELKAKKAKLTPKVEKFSKSRKAFTLALARKTTSQAKKDELKIKLEEGESNILKLSTTDRNIEKTDKLIKEYQDNLISIQKEAEKQINELKKQRDKIVFINDPETAEKKTLVSRVLRRREEAIRKREEERQRENEEALMGNEDIRIGEGKRRRGRGLKNALRNAVRKPLSIKNPNENDPNIDLYPQYDLSKYDTQIIKRR
jgi:hypothetical protein